MSAFCPSCGEPLAATPLQQLRKHCVSVRLRAIRSIEKIKAWDIKEEGPSLPSVETRIKWRDSRIAREQVTADKWASYVIAIDELVEKSE